MRLECNELLSFLLVKYELRQYTWAMEAEAEALEMLEQRRAALEAEREKVEQRAAAAFAAADAVETAEREKQTELERELAEKATVAAAAADTTTAPATAGAAEPAPAPAPAATPAAPPFNNVPSPGTGTGREVLLQGFNWESSREPHSGWYNKVTALAPKLASYGFTVIWLPPPTDSVSFEGYMPRDLYDLNSRYGSLEELKQVVMALQAAGIAVLGDAVLNHRCAHYQGNEGLWNQFGGKLAWDARAIVSDDPHFGGQGAASSGDFFTAAPNIDHSQDFVKEDISQWMRWLRAEVGYNGWRLDFVRGFWGGHVKSYMEATSPEFAVGEYW